MRSRPTVIMRIGVLIIILLAEAQVGCLAPDRDSLGTESARDRETGARSTVDIEEAPGYSAEEAYELRNALSIDNWDDGGPLMRYVFLNMGELFNQSVIHREGPIAPLAYELRPEIGNFKTSSRLGERPLDDYVRESAVDGIVIVHRDVQDLRLSEDLADDHPVGSRHRPCCVSGQPKLDSSNPSHVCSQRRRTD